MTLCKGILVQLLNTNISFCEKGKKEKKSTREGKKEKKKKSLILNKISVKVLVFCFHGGKCWCQIIRPK